MTAKQYLSQLRKLDIQINQKQQELYELRCAAERVTPASGDGFGGVGGSDRVGNIVARMGDLDDEINDDIDRLVDMRHLIINQIQQLEDARYIDILFKRYVEHKSLEQISVEMNYSYQPVRRMHGHALQAFAAKWLHNAT
ncbi:MAG: hypothetical protein ACI4PQ_08680 [Butyricicoccaceae bacterium]